MDWKKVKKKYPKSFEKLRDFGDPSSPLEIFLIELNKRCKQVSYYRFLYDFFDENGLLIDIEIMWFGSNRYYFIFEINGIHNQNIGFYDKEIARQKRKEIEEIAFLKAFELLEKELT
jgi:hypothetical protein